MKNKKSLGSSSSVTGDLAYPSQNQIRVMNSSLSSLKKESTAGGVR